MRSRGKRSIKRSVKRSVKRSGKKTSRGLKLLSIKKSPKKDKKYVATFSRNGRIKKTHFGAKGYSDYNQHKNKERRQRYIKRHKSRENWRDPTSAGALSYYLLWGPTTSFRTNVNSFKRKFNL
jgi:hypothetical protein